MSSSGFKTGALLSTLEYVAFLGFSVGLWLWYVARVPLTYCHQRDGDTSATECIDDFTDDDLNDGCNGGPSGCSHLRNQ